MRRASGLLFTSSTRVVAQRCGATPLMSMWVPSGCLVAAARRGTASAFTSNDVSTSAPVSTHGQAPALGIGLDGPARASTAKKAEQVADVDTDADSESLLPNQRPPVPGVTALIDAAPGTYRLPRDYPIPESCCKWTFSRGSGPGGQGVNSSSNKAELKVPLERIASTCTDIELDILDTLRDQAASHLTASDEIVVSSHEHRSLERNKKTCLKVVQGMLYAASFVPFPDVKHEPSFVGQTQDSIEKKRIKTHRAKASRDARKEVKNFM